MDTDTGKNTATVTWTEPTATDNDGVKAVTSDHKPNEKFPIGETTVTYTATDNSGNTASCSFKITVKGKF